VSSRQLLQLGANVNACDKYGNTPLNLSAVTACAEIVALLLQYGADGVQILFTFSFSSCEVTLKDNHGRTPLQYAQSRLSMLSEEARKGTTKALVLLICFCSFSHYVFKTG
jgi:ankyrin repeat protein